MQRHTPYPSKPLSEESSNRSAVLNLQIDRWNGRACTLGMSSSWKRVGSGTWETAEVCGDCAKYLPISSWPGREVHGEELEAWAMAAWAIWNARNRYCFEDKQTQPADILPGAMNLLQDYQRLSRHMVEPSWTRGGPTRSTSEGTVHYTCFSLFNCTFFQIQRL